jgi:general nucleoside transport system ATP-binding protein
MRFAARDWAPSGPAEALDAGIAMVHQHFSVVPRMTVVENLMLGQCHGLLRHADFSAQVRALGERFGLDVDPDAEVGGMSVGERQRVEIVKCLMREPQLLVLDEPTAVLPPEEIDALLDICRRVADSGRAVILVTHKLAEIVKVADRVSVLRGGRLVAESQMSTADIGELVRAMVGREVATLDRALAASLGVEGSRDVGQSNSPGQPGAGSLDVVMKCADLTVVDRHGTVRLDRLQLEIRRGEVVGLAGVEGNGQLELEGVLAGLVQPDSGRYTVAGKDLTRASPAEITAAGAGVVPEDRHAVACVPGMSLAENMFLNKLDRFTRFGLLRRSRLTEAAGDLMQRFDVRAAGPDVAFSSLSGGNQQKAVLARELTLDPLAFLLAAQPTRGLDIGAVEAVYQQIHAIARSGVGVLLIVSDLDELIAAADRIVVLYRGRIIGEKPARLDQRETIGAMMSGHAG